MYRRLHISAAFWLVAGILVLGGSSAWADSAESNLFSLNTQFLSPVGDGALPEASGLSACFPNPFNPTTTIRYALAKNAEVELVVYDLNGRRVRTLLSGEQVEAGQHEAVWRGLDDQGRAAAAGVYLCRLRIGEETDSLRMTLIK